MKITKYCESIEVVPYPGWPLEQKGNQHVAIGIHIQDDAQPAYESGTSSPSGQSILYYNEICQLYLKVYCKLIKKTWRGDRIQP